MYAWSKDHRVLMRARLSLSLVPFDGCFNRDMIGLLLLQEWKRMNQMPQDNADKNGSSRRMRHLPWFRMILRRNKIVGV